MENWTMVFRSDSPVTSDIIRDMLDANGVKAVVMNKQDSAFNNMLGFFEVMVPDEQVAAAEELVKAHNNPAQELAEPSEE